MHAYLEYKNFFRPDSGSTGLSKCLSYLLLIFGVHHGMNDECPSGIYNALAHMFSRRAKFDAALLSLTGFMMAKLYNI